MTQTAEQIENALYLEMLIAITKLRRDLYTYYGEEHGERILKQYIIDMMLEGGENT